ncbi:MAG: SUMF1/EgtB/PvdO family nonheme iron enzyme [Pseudomonadota bacterium]
MNKLTKIIIYRPGGRKQLKVEEGTFPHPGPNEVAVRVHAAGVNFADVVIRQGLYASAKKYVGGRFASAGQRFPWGNLISQTNANYSGNTASYAYDLGPNGLNTIGSLGGTSPATSPVGSFAPNGYGLYDMAGNVWSLPAKASK